MGTPNGNLLALANGNRNRVSSIKTTGANPNSSVSVREQQIQRIGSNIAGLPKGSNISVLVRNTHETDDMNFIMFDCCGIAAAKGAPATGGSIVFSSTFAGLGNAAGYTTLKEYLKGSHLGSLGTSFKFNDEEIIDTANLNVWNGNLENYNSQNLQNYLLLAEDTYANDQKILPMDTDLYINQFMAITGTLPAGGSINFLFNIVGVANF